MYDLRDRLTMVTNRDKIRREEREEYVEHEDFDEYLHGKDRCVLDDHLKENHHSLGFFF